MMKNSPRTCLISKRHLGFKQKFIERILLLPRISKAVILCGKYQIITVRIAESLLEMVTDNIIK